MYGTNKVNIFKRKGLQMICNKCKISEKRKHLVIGRGDIPADVLFIGEAPGKSEDTMGVPFVGPSGFLLNTMIEEASRKLKLDEIPAYYIINTILCRPYVLDESKDNYLANREPTAVEIFNCTPHVLNIIAEVKPKVTIFVGKVAETAYKSELKTSVRIYHPSFLLRYGGKTSPHYMSNIRLIEKAFSMIVS